METGIYNSLTNILSGPVKIIIPDLQRDYCWGNVNGLVKSFTESLIGASEKEASDFSLGLLYAYEYPLHYYYLCDGQQRLTSLYLILGVLNSYEKDSNIEGMLQVEVSEPRLRYEVRNSTVYFIKELLNNIFLSGNSNAIQNIEQQNWWRNDYIDDPSVISICQGLRIVYALLQGNREKRNRLKRFILEKVGFVFFNLNIKEAGGHHSQIREFGEKMYEIVNTRGVPMEPNEHLKPILVSDEKFSDGEKRVWTETWEAWQDFFWQHRGRNETADNGFNEFLRWIQIIELSIRDSGDAEVVTPKTEEIKNLFKAEKVSFEVYTLDLIKEYFIALQWIVKEAPPYFDKGWLAPKLIERAGINRKIVALNQKDYFVLLPLLFYVKKVGADKVERSFVKRLSRFFFNVNRLENINKAPDVNTIAALKAVSILLKNGKVDIAEIVHYKDTISQAIFSAEEYFKLSLFLQPPNGVTRLQLEKAFWEAEDKVVNKISGVISSILQLSFYKGAPDGFTYSGNYIYPNPSSFDYSHFIKVFDYYKQTVKHEEEIWGNLLPTDVYYIAYDRIKYAEDWHLKEGFLRIVLEKMQKGQISWDSYLSSVQKEFINRYDYHQLRSLKCLKSQLFVLYILHKNILDKWKWDSNYNFGSYRQERYPEKFSPFAEKVIYQRFESKWEYNVGYKPSYGIWLHDNSNDERDYLAELKTWATLN